MILFIFELVIIVQLVRFIFEINYLAGLTMQATILAYLFSVVESGKITVPLNPTQQTTSGQTNVTYVQEFVANLLKTAFPHLTE